MRSWLFERGSVLVGISGLTDEEVRVVRRGWPDMGTVCHVPDAVRLMITYMQRGPNRLV
jgi:hypothetical protein